MPHCFVSKRIFPGFSNEALNGHRHLGVDLGPFTKLPRILEPKQQLVYCGLLSPDCWSMNEHGNRQNSCGDYDYVGWAMWDIFIWLPSNEYIALLCVFEAIFNRLNSSDNSRDISWCDRYGKLGNSMIHMIDFELRATILEEMNYDVPSIMSYLLNQKFYYWGNQ